MSNLLKLGLAAALAAGAVILNLWWLNSRPKDPEFVAINKSIEAGAEIKQEDLEKIALPGKLDDLKKTFVAWDERALIFNRRATRPFTKGDIFLQRDVGGGPPEFEVIGPFRIVSVGEAFRDKTADGGTASASGGNFSDTHTVTVLVRHYSTANGHPYFDEKTRRLLQLIDAKTSGGRNKDKLNRSVAATSYPKGSVEPEKEPMGGDKFREMHLIVPVDDVSLSQKVLSVGDDIGFVVPSRL